VTECEPSLKQAQETATQLVGAPVLAERVLGGGRNSRIWRISCGGSQYALKQYPSRQHDPRDRLTTEVAALRLMEDKGINMVPRVMAVEQERGFVLLSWMDGALPSQISDSDIDTAVAFLGAVHKLRHVPQAQSQPLAAEACLSGIQIELQIRARLERLSGLADGPLCDFLQGEVAPAFHRQLAKARERLAGAGLDFQAELPQERRSLIPADFGFHNSLRRLDGSLVFLDFEYFGWDDPVKLTADVLLHPGVSLQPQQAERFRQAALVLYGDDPLFGERLEALYPLFGLRWVLILLNEFLPERWQQRVIAGASEEWGVAKRRQLDKAQRLLMRVS